MNEATIRSLNAINRRFYDERADEFNQTRERAWRGWMELFDRYRVWVPRSPRVLDIGCGNGRFARFLRQRLAEPFTYFGVDASKLGLEHAAKRLDDIPDVHLVEHDFIVESEPLPASLASAHFDLIVLFGVVHHIPGGVHRTRLLTHLARHLAPGGLFAYTVWRFDRFERFTRKLVPWDEFPVDEFELEPGDHIMTWGDTEPAYRYCHAMTDEDAEILERRIPLEALASFLGDDDLNRYYVLVKESPLDPRKPTQGEGSSRLE
ncbi:MAG: hypothetical protein BMS9Abin37_3279 [Acidobacteriota bacterium]|nr:MAG: hypothetical protein BMS9Abin37_3279 [Acidobacteriota bacterium]